MMRCQASKSITYDDGAIVVEGQAGEIRGMASDADAPAGHLSVAWDQIWQKAGMDLVRDTDAEAIRAADH